MRQLVLLLVLAAAGSAPPAFALDLGSVLTGYTVSAWRDVEGAPLGPVRAIAQDREGYLWLGTDKGLVRFDGFRFAAVDTLSGVPLRQDAVRALLVTSDGSMWIGFGDGAGIQRVRGGRLDDVGRLFPTINAIAEGHDATVWVAHESGLAQFRAGQWISFGAADGLEPGRRVSTVHVDRAGNVWAASATALLRRRPGDTRFQPIESPEFPARAMAAVGDAIWVTDPSTGIHRVEAATVSRPLVSGRGASLLRDRGGALWIGTIGQGLWRSGHPDAFSDAASDATHGSRATHAVERATVQTGLPSDGIWSLFEDVEGNIWVGTHEGLARLTPHAATPVADVGVVRAIAATGDGVLWAASTEGLIQLPGGTAGERVRRVWPVGPIRTLHAGRDGTIWFATDEGLGRLQRTAGAPAMLQTAYPLTRITSIGADARGVLWLVDRVHGLLSGRVDAGGIHLDRVSIPSSESVRPTFAHVTATGEVWIACDDGSIVIRSGSGAFRRYSAAEGLPQGTVNAIFDGDRNIVWVAGTSGVSRLQGDRFLTVGRKGGLPEDRVVSIAQDGAGSLWLGMQNIGIIRIATEELLLATSRPLHRVRFDQYDTSGGIAGMPVALNHLSTARGRDGRLWFVTGRGLTIVDPAQLARAKEPRRAPPRIEAGIADERRFTAIGDVALPARTKRLRIDYTALSLTSPERVRFRYRLDGFDRDWVDAGMRRQAFYTNLPPGQYRFRLETAGNDKTWNRAEAAWTFSIEPTFYQSRWFVMTSVVGIALAAAGAWRLRVRKLRRELALIFSERSRLSRELHDTLLQSLVGIALQLDIVGRRADAGQQGELLRIRRYIEQYIREVRQSIWDLRSPSLERGGLTAALGAAAERATAGTAVAFELTVNGQPQPCSPRVETQLLRVAQEAITNAVRHAQPHHLHVELSFDASSLALRVKDDGCGFDPRVVPERAGHCGLSNMRERVEQLGGRFVLSAARGGGTTIEAIVPLGLPA